MTDNQENQLFKTLETLVSGMQIIQTDVKEIKKVQKEHSQILNKHSQILNKHSQILERLDAKTDTIAEKVMNHEIRLTKAEQNIEELQGGVH